jgi:hypothetical protein
MSDYWNKLSTDTQDMLAIVDLYEQGSINLDHAVERISSFCTCSAESVKAILEGITRDNVVKLTDALENQTISAEETLSIGTSTLLDIGDQYADGRINKREAVERILALEIMDEIEICDLLGAIQRQNVIRLFE